MCGIFGIYGEVNNPNESLKMLAHRGPDGQGTYVYPRALLGHTRLAIVDVDGGQQPLCDETGTRWLVCNGEIYNHPNLRGLFTDYRYQTDSDSEDILALYGHYESETPRYLRGMFAFAVLDDGKLFLARDPLGIKPLYYGWRDDTLYFSSEIKALTTSVMDIHEFPPGHIYRATTGTFTPYYDVREVAQNAARAEAPTLTDIRASLKDAVNSHLMSDVPLGVFLSGGLDSSIIAALVAEGAAGVHTFSVGMDGGKDLLFAREVAKALGTTHHEAIYTEQDMIDALPDVIYYLESFDPALVRSAVANYFLARLAAEHVTVVLSGEGADELFSGYAYLKQLPDKQALERELVDITSELHNRNLQRFDRMTMAHGLEGRVPFLDTPFVEFAFRVPIEQKLYGNTAIEKWALRKAFEADLPQEVVWRTKEKFSKGAGSAHVFAHIADDTIDDMTFAREVEQVYAETGHRVCSKEELYYYRVFRQFFEARLVGLVGFSRSL